MAIFLFHFFCQWQNLVFGHKVSSLQENQRAGHVQLKWKIAVLQFSVTSKLWILDSLCVYCGHLPNPLYTLFIPFWLPQECKEPVSKNHAIGMISGFQDEFMQFSWTWYLLVLFMVKIIQISPTGIIFQAQSQFGPPLKFLLCLLLTQQGAVCSQKSVDFFVSCRRNNKHQYGRCPSCFLGVFKILKH